METIIRRFLNDFSTMKIGWLKIHKWCRDYIGDT